MIPVGCLGRPLRAQPGEPSGMPFRESGVTTEVIHRIPHSPPILWHCWFFGGSCRVGSQLLQVVSGCLMRGPEPRHRPPVAGTEPTCWVRSSGLARAGAVVGECGSRFD